ncbi:MAG TPA: permease-like cell division protein FtsX [Steroidobacteraceae bacterium]|nr:permease-like cell division protein FtsX [Steroidobacteraceae bacterium]
MSLGVFGTRHLQALLGSCGRLARNPLATALTLLVVALALALPAALGLFVRNAQVATGGFGNAVDMSVYLKSGVSVAKAQQLAADARQRPGVARVTVIPADQGLQQFRQYSGFGAALDALKSNPLPNVLHVVPRAGASSAADLQSLRRYFAAWPEVDVVQLDTEWVLRFNAILGVLRRLVLIAAVLLGAGVLAVIGNTIRLEILNRRAEIEVTKLVGGSNAFVRRPFLYTGLIYGVGGAVLAWAILEAAVLVLDPSVATLAQLYGSRYALQGPSGQILGALFGGGMALGWLGAWISAHRHLRSIEPRA